MTKNDRETERDCFPPGHIPEKPENKIIKSTRSGENGKITFIASGKQFRNRADNNLRKF